MRALTSFLQRTFFTTPGVLLILVVLFTVLYAGFYAASNGLYHSPDEQAVAVFSRHFAESNTLKIARPLASEIVLPRSVNIMAGDYVPGSFIGLPLLLGYTHRFLGEPGFLLLIPLLAAAAPAALFVLLRKPFGKGIAWTSAVILWVSPAWIYYASRGYLPNIAFVSSVLLALAMWQERARFKPLAVFAGLFAGLSLAIRPVEALWVIPVYAVFLWMYRPRFSQAFAALCGLILPVAVMAFWQAQTYGAWYRTGYDALSAAPAAGDAARHLGRSLFGALFPFGFHPWAAFERFVLYQWKLLWWQLPFFVLGIGLLLKGMRKKPAYKKYAWFSAVVFAYLIMYYGSWNISDHPDPAWVSLGVAYNRYWLPLAVLSAPVFALALERLWRKELGFAWLVVCSFAFVFAVGDDSLWAMRANGVKYEYSRRQLAHDLPPGSVVLTEREDKWLWPTFSVIQQSNASINRLPEIADETEDIYWMTSLPASHAAELEQRLFAPQQYALQSMGAYQDWRLYKLVPHQQQHEMD